MEAVTQSKTTSASLAAKPIKDMLVFSGRSTRTEALGFTLLVTVFGQIPAAIAGDLSDPIRVATGLALGLLIHLPVYALFVRRMHDLDRSGWWVWIPTLQTALAVVLLLQPNVGGGARITFLIWSVRPGGGDLAVTLLSAILALILVEIVIFFCPGTPTPNRYGPDPRVR